MLLTPGQNIALSTTTLRFTASSAGALDMSALVADGALRALSSDDFVFYNQPHTRGVRWGEGGVEIDLDAVRPDAHAVLCIASVDPLAGPGAVFTGVTAHLHDRDGTTVARIEVECRAGETALICWEVYRRAGTWKLRAVAQGYSDGLAGLIGRHGVDVDGADAAVPAAAVGPVGAVSAEYGPIEPLDPQHIVERFEMIMEDGARSVGAYLSARQFAESRLDQELSAAIADPATRNGPQAVESRARAQQRHDTIVDEAFVRYSRDSTHLETELRTIGPVLPRSFAAWNDAPWTAGGPGGGPSNGIRIGDLSAPHCGPLRIPVCLPLPFRQPLCVVGPDTAGTAAVTSSAVLRMLAADRNMHLDVVDVSGTLHTLTAGLAHRGGGTTVTDVDAIGPYLESVSAAIELALLDGDVGGPGPVPRTIVLNHVPYGYDSRHLPLIGLLADRGRMLGVSLVIVGDDPSAIEDVGHDLVRRSYALPAGESDWHDPWTSNVWTFTPDRIPTDTHQFSRIVATIVDR